MEANKFAATTAAEAARGVSRCLAPTAHSERAEINNLVLEYERAAQTSSDEIRHVNARVVRAIEMVHAAARDSATEVYCSPQLMKNNSKLLTPT